MILPRLSLALLLAWPFVGSAAPLAVDPAAVKIEVEARATMHGFTGKLDRADVSLEGDPAAGTISTAEVRFAWADLKTGDKGRDQELMAWATANSPDGVFLLATLRPSGQADTFTATGSLSLNGQSHDVTFPVKVVRTAAGWDVSGSTKIDHRDWGLPKIRKFGLLTVDPAVTIRFALRATATE